MNNAMPGMRKVQLETYNGIAVPAAIPAASLPEVKTRPDLTVTPPEGENMTSDGSTAAPFTQTPLHRNTKDISHQRIIMNRLLAKTALGALLAAATISSAAAGSLPRGFYVANQERGSIEFHRQENGRVYVRMTTHDMGRQSFADIVNTIAHASGSSSCTKMKDSTPIGGPRFHCQYNMDRTPYTLHLIPYYQDHFVLSVVISGDNYPGFGISYDDVQDMIDYWFSY